ncbi:hypothetical protein [Dialister sp.]|uniref:hypothetical protein n=1 Tax=Dialister sp. TaxID=1955814 RepID=UPI003F091E9E
MEYVIDDGYVDLDRRIREMEYLMEKVLIDAGYISSLAGGEESGSSYDDDDDDFAASGLEAMTLRLKLDSVREAAEEMRRNAEEARDAASRLRHDIDWYGEKR